MTVEAGGTSQFPQTPSTGSASQDECFALCFARAPSESTGRHVQSEAERRGGAILPEANTGRVRSFTISEAAEATGLTQKALRARIEQGRVRAVLREGMPPRIPESELRRAGLLPDRSEPEPANGEPAEGSEIVRELVAVIERQAAELAALRARRSDGQ